MLFSDSFVPGWLFYVLAYYFAWRGLKTPKKGLAIATFVITSISLALTILAYILTIAVLSQQ